MTKKNYKTYMHAAHFFVLRYPVPATFGVPGMRAVTQQALNLENVPVDTSILAFTPSGTRATILYYAPDGSTELVKRHANGRVFDTAKALAGARTRHVVLSEADICDLMTPEATK